MINSFFRVKFYFYISATIAIGKIRLTFQRKWAVENVCEKNKILNKRSNEFARISRKIVEENFRFLSHFRWLIEIFAKEIEQ